MGISSDTCYHLPAATNYLTLLLLVSVGVTCSNTSLSLWYVTSWQCSSSSKLPFPKRLMLSRLSGTETILRYLYSLSRWLYQALTCGCYSSMGYSMLTLTSGERLFASQIEGSTWTGGMPTTLENFGVSGTFPSTAS